MSNTTEIDFKKEAPPLDDPQAVQKWAEDVVGFIMNPDKKEVEDGK